MRRASTNDLANRLTGYSATLRSSRIDENHRRRFTNWQVYAAVTGSALAMTTSASASVIHSTPNITVIMNTFTGASGLPPAGGSEKQAVVKIDNTAGHTIKSFIIDIQQAKLNGQIGGLLNIGQNGSHAGLGKIGFLLTQKTANAFVKNLSSNARHRVTSGKSLVGTAFNNNGTHGVAAFGFAAGYFGKAGLASGVPEYAGFRFSYNGHADYGWVKLEYTDSAKGVPDSFTASNMTVDLTPSPEPSTGALAILAAGAAAVMALRRRKKIA